MFVPWADLNRFHLATSLCTWGAERKRWRLVEEKAWTGEMTEFQYYDQPLEKVFPFNYLGRLLTETDDKYMTAIANLWKARKSWY